MKIYLLSLLLPLSALASQEKLVRCELKDFSICQACEKRIPASCEDKKIIGLLETSLKPQKVQWTVFNKTSGTEKKVLVTGSSVTLKDLESTSKMIKKFKIKVSSQESVSLSQVFLKPGTLLYKNSDGSEVVSQLKVQNSPRDVASVNSSPHFGGVKRAQKIKDQSKE